MSSNDAPALESDARVIPVCPEGELLPVGHAFDELVDALRTAGTVALVTDEAILAAARDLIAWRQRGTVRRLSRALTFLNRYGLTPAGPSKLGLVRWNISA